MVEQVAPLCSLVFIQLYHLLSERLFRNKGAKINWFVQKNEPFQVSTVERDDFMFACNQEEGDSVPTQGTQNATKKLMIVPHANHCIKVLLVFPLKHKSFH